jgi:nitroreductase
MSNNTFADLVKRARSCRRYAEADAIPAQVVRDLVDVVRLVPSAGNQQPLRYRIVTESAERQRLFAHLKWAGALKDWGGPKEGERPTGYVIILTPAGKNAAVDVGIAAQTMQLAAASLGYGACMLGAIDRAAIHMAFDLPKELEVQLVVALGRVGEKIVLEKMPESGNHAYWRTADQVHHVPKRSLDEVLVK